MSRMTPKSEMKIDQKVPAGDILLTILGDIIPADQKEGIRAEANQVVQFQADKYKELKERIDKMAPKKKKEIEAGFQEFMKQVAAPNTK